MGKSDIQNEINDLNKEKAGIVKDLADIESALSSLKQSLSDQRYNKDIYSKVLLTRYGFINQKNKYIKRIMDINQRKSVLSVQNQQPNTNKVKTNELRQVIHGIKDKYSLFHRDKTRISAMRNMAQDFIIDLERILKQLK